MYLFNEANLLVFSLKETLPSAFFVYLCSDPIFMINTEEYEKIAIEIIFTQCIPSSKLLK